MISGSKNCSSRLSVYHWVTVTGMVSWILVPHLNTLSFLGSWCFYYIGWLDSVVNIRLKIVLHFFSCRCNHVMDRMLPFSCQVFIMCLIITRAACLSSSWHVVIISATHSRRAPAELLRCAASRHTSSNSITRVGKFFEAKMRFFFLLNIELVCSSSLLWMLSVPITMGHGIFWTYLWDSFLVLLI